MISLREVEDTIRELEAGAATYNNCMKLASLYIIRDELMEKEEGYYNYRYAAREGRPSRYARSSTYGRTVKPITPLDTTLYTEPMMYHKDDDLLINDNGMYTTSRM